MVSVLVVDDHPLFRLGLVATLRRREDLVVIGHVGSSSEALALAREARVDLVILDLVMPETSGITLAAELRELQPECAVLGLSVVDDPGVIADFLRTSGGGFALKTQPIAEIHDAIDRVLAGERYLPPTISALEVDAQLYRDATAPLQALTRREREVFELLIRGRSNDEIAQRLFIAKRTVETHRYRVMHKLSAHSIVQLQRYSARFGDSRGWQ